MEPFLNKDQLLLQHLYQWSEIPEGDPRVSGSISDIPFNRLEGYEVLYLINELMNIWKFNEVRYARKLEKMIRFGLPEGSNTQQLAKSWIKEHWGNY